MNDAMVLVVVFGFLLFAGVPIAYAIGLAAFAGLMVSLDPAVSATVVAQRLATGLDSFALLAIPFFILSGQLMNQGGIARRLIALARIMVVATVLAIRRGIAPMSESDAPDPVPAWKVVLDAVPSLLLILVVMGGIIVGWFTPTEASAIAVVYTFVLSVLVYREVSWNELANLFTKAACTTSVVLLLVGTSMGMSWMMAAADIPQTISSGLLSISDQPWIILLLIVALLLVVGTFMDMTPAVLIFTPILLPIVSGFGMSPVHFGIVLIFTLCVGLVTAPVGSVLFVGCGVAGTSIAKIWRPLLPFYGAMLIALLIVVYWPALSLWLPSLLGFE